MFDFKNFQKLQKDLQEQMEGMEKELGEQKVEATSGGGVITVVANGVQEILSVKIKPEAVDPDDIEMLEDLVLAAVNSAIQKSKDLNQNKMSRIMGGFKLPGLPF